MSAIVQLSYNINEKLRLDDRKFPGFEVSAFMIYIHNKPKIKFFFLNFCFLGA